MDTDANAVTHNHDHDGVSPSPAAGNQVGNQEKEPGEEGDQYQEKKDLKQVLHHNEPVVAAAITSSQIFQFMPTSHPEVNLPAFDVNQPKGVKRIMRSDVFEEEEKQDRMSILPDHHQEQNHEETSRIESAMIKKRTRETTSTTAYDADHDVDADAGHDYEGEGRILLQSQEKEVIQLPHHLHPQQQSKRIKREESSEQDFSFQSIPVTQQQSSKQQVFVSPTLSSFTGEEEKGILSPNKMSSESSSAVTIMSRSAVGFQENVGARKYIEEEKEVPTDSSAFNKKMTTTDLMTGGDEEGKEEKEDQGRQENDEHEKEVGEGKRTQDITSSPSSSMLLSLFPSSSPSSSTTTHEDNIIPETNPDPQDSREREGQENEIREDKRQEDSTSTTNDETNSPLKLFVGQIPREWNDDDCRQMFESETGFNVMNISVLRDKKTGQSRGECRSIPSSISL